MLVRGTLEQALLRSRTVQTQSSLVAEWYQQMAWASGWPNSEREKGKKGKKQNQYIQFEKSKKEENRKDCTFWRQFDEKPSITPGCPGTKQCMCQAAAFAYVRQSHLSQSACIGQPLLRHHILQAVCMLDIPISDSAYVRQL